MALCKLTTSTGTRINTLISNTRLIGRTIRVQYAFWSANFVRVTNVFGNARARSGIVLFLTNCVGTAWRRDTGRNFNGWLS